MGGPTAEWALQQLLEHGQYDPKELAQEELSKLVYHYYFGDPRGANNVFKYLTTLSFIDINDRKLSANAKRVLKNVQLRIESKSD